MTASFQRGTPRQVSRNTEVSLYCKSRTPYIARFPQHGNFIGKPYCKFPGTGKFHLSASFQGPGSFSFTAQGPGKVAWSFQDVRRLAMDLRMGLPLSVAQVLASPEWKGGVLVQLEDTMTTPKAEDLVLNYPWVLPFVKQFRDRIPSQFFITDCFVYLDKTYNDKLFLPVEPGVSKLSLAVDEAKKIKLLMGALRALWRSSTLVII